jgi:hypothetical protein
MPMPHGTDLTLASVGAPKHAGRGGTLRVDKADGR